MSPEDIPAETPAPGRPAPDAAEVALDVTGPRPGLSAMVWIPLLSAALMAGLIVAGWHSFAL